MSGYYLLPASSTHILMSISAVEGIKKWSPGIQLIEDDQFYALLTFLGLCKVKVFNNLHR